MEYNPLTLILFAKTRQKGKAIVSPISASRCSCLSKLPPSRVSVVIKDAAVWRISGMGKVRHTSFYRSTIQGSIRPRIDQILRNSGGDIYIQCNKRHTFWELCGTKMMRVNTSRRDCCTYVNVFKSLNTIFPVQAGLHV